MYNITQNHKSCWASTLKKHFLPTNVRRHTRDIFYDMILYHAVI